MSLQAMLSGNWFEQLATATFATPATPEPDLPEIAPTVATVAKVAVANRTDQKAANEIMRLNPKLPDALDKGTGTFTARRCGKWQALGLLSAAIPGDTVDLLQRCASFDDRLAGMA
ncbi:hypothetical protein KVP09_15095 [Alcaligenaceae bacterium CGII-47]|nr:hypothetical protein [Alcaligenaceae bacterium CGII-47]